MTLQYLISVHDREHNRGFFLALNLTPALYLCNLNFLEMHFVHFYMLRYSSHGVNGGGGAGCSVGGLVCWCVGCVGGWATGGGSRVRGEVERAGLSALSPAQPCLD